SRPMRRALALLSTAAAVAIASTWLLIIALPAIAKTSTVTRFHNCTQLNRTYPHGVGRAGAHDHVSSSHDTPVTNFKVSTKIYSGQWKALDRDHDGIGCEEN